jgi:hypothetical protein
MPRGPRRWRHRRSDHRRPPACGLRQPPRLFASGGKLAVQQFALRDGLGQGRFGSLQLQACRLGIQHGGACPLRTVSPSCTATRTTVPSRVDARDNTPPSTSMRPRATATWAAVAGAVAGTRDEQPAISNTDTASTGKRGFIMVS